uniref:Tetratricopeptide repeat n=1 Tax=Candidatus Kentrum sp. UNK TaxID=2126344 RepID=A0A451AZC6_9GAMM|nr:MAG: Tetratricopeptide repeat [Candidatus Kentron sp. UNK]VFK71381.1 MAG: Tetratricopeptide repeat [Candidatus Kentron sp. UNK]
MKIFTDWGNNILKVLSSTSIIFLLASFSSLFAANTENLSLSIEKLAGTMDRQVLEQEIERLETTRGAIGEAEYRKRIGIAWHNLSALEVDDASGEADKWLGKASASSPSDYEVMAYYGSARTMVARDSWNVVTKVSSVNKGLALIDKAIRKAPDNVIVRMVRANNSLALPEFFERRPKAREDFGFLHARLDKLDISPETSAEICFKLGRILEEDGEREKAKALYEEARTIAPQSSWAKEAAEL